MFFPKTSWPIFGQDHFRYFQVRCILIFRHIRKLSPTLSRLYPDFIPTLSRLYPDFLPTLARLYPDFIPTLSRLYPDFILTLSRLYPDFIPTLSKLGWGRMTLSAPFACRNPCLRKPKLWSFPSAADVILRLFVLEAKHRNRRTVSFQLEEWKGRCC